MIFIKIKDILYPATITGRIADKDWDNRPSKSITLEMDYIMAITLFTDNAVWSIVEQNEVPVYDENNVYIETKIEETEYDNSEYSLAGDVTDHRDGTITVKMGKLTELEEAYEFMLGDI